MTSPRRLLVALLAAASLTGLPACGEDDVSREAEKAGQEAEEGANKAKKEGEKAVNEAEKAKEDVDGQ
jgi:hypothetical protein